MNNFVVISPGWNCKAYVQHWYNTIAIASKGYNVKIIAINDASTDSTRSLLKKIAEKDSRVVLINHAENLGPAHSRWLAFKYIRENGYKFSDICVNIDLDDYIAPNFFKVLDLSYKPHIKMSMGGLKRFTDKVYTEYEIDNKICNKREEYLGMAPITFRVGLIDGLKKEFFLDNNGKWLEYCTDVPLCYGLLNQIKSREIVYIKQNIYYYTQRADGTQKKFKNKKKEMFEILKQRDYSPNINLSSEKI